VSTSAQRKTCRWPRSPGVAVAKIWRNHVACSRLSPPGGASKRAAIFQGDERLRGVPFSRGYPAELGNSRW